MLQHTSALNHVNWLQAQDSLLDDDEAVLGLLLNGQAWALSWRQLSHYHIANLDINGEPVLMSWCGMCSAGAAFSRYVKGKTLYFSMSDRYNGTYAMEDDVFSSSWHPFSGENISSNDSELLFLDPLDLTQCSWKEWRSMNPSTYVAECDKAAVFGKSVKPGGMEKLGLGFRKSVLNMDPRLPEMEMSVGLLLGEFAYAFCMRDLDVVKGVYECSLHGQDIILIKSQDSWLVRASFNCVRGKKMSFYVDESGCIFDRETKSQWDYMGRAVAGKLQGEVLQRCQYSIQAWYAWSTEYPATELIRITASQKPKDLQ